MTSSVRVVTPAVNAMPVLHGVGLGGMMRVVNAGVSGGFCPVHMFT